MIPPWAAILCALRAESWKQKTLTLYPNSEREAAAEAPAKPEPIIIISKFLLLEGLTKGTVERYLVHFVSSAPSGIFESSIEAILLVNIKLFEKEINRHCSESCRYSD